MAYGRIPQMTDAVTTRDRRLLVVFAGPRSGSNFLCDTLEGIPGMIGLSEVFNPREIYGLNKHPELRQRLLDEFGSSEKLIHAFRMMPGLAIDALIHSTQDARWVMIKVCPNQIHSAALRSILAKHAAGAIFLVRRRLDQFVSLGKAMASDQWHSADTTGLRPSADFEAFLRWSTMMDGWIDRTAQTCKSLGLPVASLRYDRDLLMADPKARTSALSARLAVLPLGATSEMLSKQSFFRRQDLTVDVFDRIENGPQFHAALIRHRLLDFALGEKHTAFDASPEPGPMMRRDTVAAMRMATLLKNRNYSDLREMVDQIGRSIDGDPRVPQPLPDRDHSFRRVTFVCGLHKSGTTLFHDTLAARYDVAHLKCEDVPRNEGQFLQDVAPQERAFGGPGSFAFHSPMCPPPETDPKRARLLADRMLRHWASFATDPHHPHLLEKSPPNLTRIAWLRSLFPQARFLIFVRDPRATALATRKWRPLPLETLVLHWNAAHLSALRDLAEDCLVLTYEAFCDDPGAVADQAATFCEMQPRDYDAPQVSPALVNSNPAYIPLFPKTLSLALPFRAWEVFGYQLDLAGDPVRKT